MTNGCMRKLSPGQWWSYCGETDMGQTAPFLCTECGGSGKLEDGQQAPVDPTSKFSNVVNFQGRPDPQFGGFSASHEALIELGQLRERERCARICEELESAEEEGWAQAGSFLANRIRSGS